MSDHATPSMPEKAQPPEGTPVIHEPTPPPDDTIILPDDGTTAEPLPEGTHIVVVERSTLRRRGLQAFDSLEAANEFRAGLGSREGVVYELEEVQVTEPRRVERPTQEDLDST